MKVATHRVLARCAVLGSLSVRGRSPCADNGDARGSGDRTEQRGAAGTTVELTGVPLQGTRAAVTGADGRYRFLSLVQGDYTVTARLDGFASAQKKATVTLDALTTANIPMTVAAFGRRGRHGQSPLIDVSSTTAGSNYAGKVIDKLTPKPQLCRHRVHAAGIQADNGETQGRSLAISIYGSTSAENSFLIDGVDTTNVIKGIQGKDINDSWSRKWSWRPSATRPMPAATRAASST